VDLGVVRGGSRVGAEVLVVALATHLALGGAR
jgi:hypothetical protein